MNFEESGSLIVRETFKKYNIIIWLFGVKLITFIVFLFNGINLIRNQFNRFEFRLNIRYLYESNLLIIVDIMNSILSIVLMFLLIIELYYGSDNQKLKKIMYFSLGLQAFSLFYGFTHNMFFLGYLNFTNHLLPNDLIKTLLLHLIGYTVGIIQLIFYISIVLIIQRGVTKSLAQFAFINFIGFIVFRSIGIILSIFRYLKDLRLIHEINDSDMLTTYIRINFSQLGFTLISSILFAIIMGIYAQRLKTYN